MPATANLADMYATGVNGGMTVTQDIPKAIELYSRVSQDALFVRGVHGLNLLAKEGHPEAMVRLGDFFAYNDAAKSLSLEQRWAYANKWYGKAAEAKYPAGLYLLGTGYRQMAMDQLRAGKVEAANKSSKDAKQALREAEDLGYDVNNDMWRKNLIRNEKASEIRGQKDF